jgi:outer membrane protein assembly factor BamE (lipoprotein component of BamABCDE complex)
MNCLKFIVLTMLLTLTACYTFSDISRASMLSNGMSKESVAEVMGSPIRSEFSGNLEEWHYCSTGLSADEFVALFFNQGVLFATSNYTVIGLDGDCPTFIKMGNYREPDAVIEFRSR